MKKQASQVNTYDEDEESDRGLTKPSKQQQQQQQQQSSRNPRKWKWKLLWRYQKCAYWKWWGCKYL